MNGLAEGIQNTVQYIDDNLTDELSIDDIAEKTVAVLKYQSRSNERLWDCFGDSPKDR